MVYIDEQACIGCGSCVRGCPMGVLRVTEKTAQVQPRRRCIQCMHCAATCPKQAVHFQELPDGAVYPPMPEEPLEKLIKTRRSIRHYSQKIPDRDLIQWALDTAVYAPSGKNQRAYHFTVVWGIQQTRDLRDRCLQLCEAYGEAPELVKLQALGTDLLTCGAPCMIVAWSPEDCLNPVLDPGVAMAQLELLLVDKGLGTCWAGYLRQVSDRFPEIRTYLGIPEGCRVRCALLVGYPQGETYRGAVWRPKVEANWITEVG